MGLTKQYLRYVHDGSFNIIANPNCNVVFVTLKNQEGRFLAAGASEDVVVWDLRLAEKALVLPGEKHEVCQLSPINDNNQLAVAYADGSLKTFDLESTDVISVFTGHKSNITVIQYDNVGHRLATGSKDTDIVLWDVVAECGLHRLSGHKGMITGIQFMSQPGHHYLVSSAKDTFVKIWDADTGDCFKTMAAHLTEVWGVCVMQQDGYLVSGSNDAELKVWNVRDRSETDLEDKDKLSEQLNQLLISEDEPDLTSPLHCDKAGSILRTGKGRVHTMLNDKQNQILCCHGNNNVVDLFYFCTKEESDTRWRKRLRKLKKKEAKKLSEDPMEVDEDSQASIKGKPELTDVVKRLPAIKADSKTGKIKSIDIIQGGGGELRVALLLNNNSLELHSLSVGGSTDSLRHLRSIQSQGHHSEVRALAFSSDNLAIVSACGSQIKIWNRHSLSCLRTIDTGCYALCVCFVPGDRHVLVGGKDGRLLIVDIGAGQVLEEIPAHTEELWSVAMLPDQIQVVTGGGDKSVKLWQLELLSINKKGDEEASESGGGGLHKVLSLLHTRTLKLEETVLCARVSPDSKLLAVSLLDTTVKIFFLDTFKFFISLYGHKLPVLCLDMSYDSTLIATGSTDRCVKIWGLDYGDCHKSLLAHEDSVTGLAFVPKTHHFFTASKDGRVKQWDGDNFERIVTLHGHNGEAHCLAVSPSGQHIVSSGSDRTIRLYSRTEEVLVLEDERETERGEQEEESLATGDVSHTAGRKQLNLASRKTVTAETAAELLMECLSTIAEYELECKEYAVGGKPAPPLPPIMKALKVTSSRDYLMTVLGRIRSTELEEVLLVLSLDQVTELLIHLVCLLEAAHHRTELVIRVAVFLVRIHHGPLTASKQLLPVLSKLERLASQRVDEIRDVVGYNLHTMYFLQRELEEKESVQMFLDATLEKRTKDKKKRKRESAKKIAIIAM
uniref:WD repeat-containing protein 3 n=1 Tax=Cacopsylla melanoneura TaxID=428564 RepID=A0A8D8LZD4_9HEMI